MSKIGILARIPAQPGKRDEVVEALKRAAAASEQNEPGCLAYTIHEDAKDPDVVWMYELYTDQDALDAHPKSDHYKQLTSEIGGVLTGRPELTFLNHVGGKGL